MDVCQLKKDMNGLLRNESMSIGDYVIAISVRTNSILDECELPHAFVPGGRWEADQGRPPQGRPQRYCTSPGLKAAVGYYFECKGAKKEPGQFIGLMNRLKTEWQKNENYQADCKEASCKVADNEDARRGGKQKNTQGSAVAISSKITARVFVEGC